MWRRTLTYFSLFTFIFQLGNLSWYSALLVASYTPYSFAAEQTPFQSAEQLNSQVTQGFALPTMDASGKVNIYGRNEHGEIVTTQFGEGELLGEGYEQARDNNHFQAADAYQNEAELERDKQTLRQRIDRNPVGSETDYDVAAWNTLNDARGNRVFLDSDDTIMTDTETLFNDLAESLEGENDWFSDCTTQSNTFSVNKEYVGKTKYECQEPDTTNLNYCEIERYVDYPVIKTNGTGTLTYVDDHTFQLVVGNPSARIWGQCAEYNYSVQIKIREDLEIEQVRMKYALFDDHIQIYLNNDIIYQHANVSSFWQDENGFPYTNYNPKPPYSPSSEIYGAPGMTPYGTCERSTIWKIGDGGTHGGFPNGGDVTERFEQARASGHGLVNFRNRVAAADWGYSYSIIEIKTKNRASPKEFIEQTPPGCATQLGYVQPRSTCDILGSPGSNPYINPQCDADQTFGNGQVGQVCTFSEWECTDASTPPDTYYPHVSSFPPISSGVTTDSKQCTKINAKDYQCNPLPGMQVCQYPNYPDDSDPVCSDFTSLNQNAPDQCAPYRDNPDCELVDSEPSFSDPVTGRVYIQESTYECNTYTSRDYAYTLEEDICSGEMLCVGGECSFHELENNADFGEAMATFKMLEDIKQNLTCENPDDVESCRVFEGQARYCGVEKTGLGYNCCTLSAGQTNVLDYLKMTYNVYSLEQAMAGLTDQGVIGAWGEQIPTPISDGVSYVTDSFSRGYDYIAREVFDVESVASEAGETLMGEAVNQIKQEMMSFAFESLGGAEGLGGLLFENIGDKAAGETILQLNPAISGAFSAIAGIYAAYQVVKLAIQMISACSDEEMSMGMTIDEGKCIYGGESCHIDTFFGCLVEREYYCCYPSPLGRIIMEQAAPQLGMTLDPMNGQCKGMTLRQIAELDWDQIDFSEWEAMIMASGLAVEHDDLTLDNLSSKPWMPNNDNALDPVTLNEERFREQNIQQNINDRRDHLQYEENLDCSVVPRPEVCGSPLRLVE
ncbi:conjugal transfer protein TraN [Vibrio maritimus]